MSKHKHKSIKWIIPKKEIEDALDLITNIPPRAGVSASEYIKMSKHEDKSASFSLTSDCAAAAFVHSKEKFPFKSDLYLDRRLLAPFVAVGKETKGSHYEITATGEAIEVKHGIRRVIYAKAKAGSGYQDPPRYKSKHKTELNEAWTSILRCAIACGVDDTAAPQFNCVYVVPVKEGVKLYSTNVKIAFIAHIRHKKVPKHKIAFPLRLAGLSSLENMTSLVWDDKSAMISSLKGKVWQAIKLEARKHFPYKQFDKLTEELSRTKSIAFAADCESLSACAVRMAAYLSAVTREDLILKMEVKKGLNKLRLTCGTGYTVFSEYVNLGRPATKDLKIEWPLEEVLPVLEFGKNEGEARVYTSESGRTLYQTKHISLVIASKEKEKKRKKVKK